jgi:hypothetical protein
VSLVEVLLKIVLTGHIERLQREWRSPVYAFFQPTPKIVELNGRRAHEFKCSGRGCKATIRRFLDKKDAYSTGNMRKHVKACWGTDVMAVAETARNVEDVRTKIVKDILRNGNITVAFEQKNQVTYSHRQHTKAEIRYDLSQYVVERTMTPGWKG